jgi:hypothetical protein
MTMTEDAIEQLLRVYGPGAMPDVDVEPLIERCERAGMRKLRGNQAAVQIDPVALRTLIDAALAAKAITKMSLPPGLILTKQYFAMLSVLDRIQVGATASTAPATLNDCPHENLRPGKKPGWECADCGSFASARRIFEAEVAYIDDTSSPEQLAIKRGALVRRLLSEPAT